MTGDRSELVIVGRIGGAHGVKGWVRIDSFTDPAANIVDYRPWLIRQGDRWDEVEVQCEQRGKTFIAHIGSCGSRDDALVFKGKEIAVRRHRLPELESGEYYWRQLQGLAVFDLKGRRLGRVDHLLETGANDVLVVKGDNTSLDRRERLIPYLSGRVVMDVDLGNERITVDWDADF